MVLQEIWTTDIHRHECFKYLKSLVTQEILIEVTIQYHFSYQIRKVKKKRKEEGRKQNLKPQINKHSKIQKLSYLLLAKMLIATTLVQSNLAVYIQVKRFIFMTHKFRFYEFIKTIKGMYRDLAIRVDITSLYRKLKYWKQTFTSQ